MISRIIIFRKINMISRIKTKKLFNFHADLYMLLFSFLVLIMTINSDRQQKTRRRQIVSFLAVFGEGVLNKDLLTFLHWPRKAMDTWTHPPIPVCGFLGSSSLIVCIEINVFKNKLVNSIG